MTPSNDTIMQVRANTPPQSTWNKLRINDISLELTTPQSTGAVFDRLPQLFRTIECGAGEEAVAWAEAKAGNANYIEVKAQENREEPIVIHIRQGMSADTGIYLREAAQAKVLVLADGDGDPSASLLRIIVGRNATLSLTEIIACPSTQTHLENVGIVAHENAHIELKQYFLGGNAAVSGCAVSLDGANSTLALSCRYIVRAGETLDINHLVRARGKGSEETLVTSGFLGEGSVKTLRETIDLIHGAKGSCGNEAETVVIAGENVVNKTLPTILCDEDDVVGNHGATIGSIGEESLGYLADRGLNENDVHALFMRAIFDDALIHAPNKESKAAIFSHATYVLGSSRAEDLALEA